MPEEQTIVDDYHAIKERLNSINSEIEDIVDTLLSNAEFYADMFKEGRSLAYSESDRKEFTTLGVKVRLRDGLISAEWYRNYNFSSDATTSSGEKRKPYSKYMRKNTRTGYSKATFNSEPDWARQMAIMAESRFKDVRQVNSLLSVMRRNVKAINTTLGKMEVQDRKLLDKELEIEDL